jgi:hypothetical protein
MKQRQTREETNKSARNVNVFRLKRGEVYFDGGFRHGIMDHPSVVPAIFGAMLTIVTDEDKYDKVDAQSEIVPVPDVDIAYRLDSTRSSFDYSGELMHSSIRLRPEK